MENTMSGNAQSYFFHYSAWLLLLQGLLCLVSMVWINEFSALVYVLVWIMMAAVTATVTRVSWPASVKSIVACAVELGGAFVCFDLGCMIAGVGNLNIERSVQWHKSIEQSLGQTYGSAEPLREYGETVRYFGEALTTTGPFQPVAAVVILAVASLILAVITCWCYHRYLYRKGDYHPL